MISTPPPVVLALKKENHDSVDEDALSKKNKYDNTNEQGELKILFTYNLHIF